jgi:aerobic-type carbon monoxide dehydrogenase small subunit (CoxS/CutS family)
MVGAKKRTSSKRKVASQRQSRKEQASGLVSVDFTLNGKRVSVRVHPMARLLDVLRDSLGMFGTKEGCGEGECGACSILVNDDLVNTCLVPVLQVSGAKLRTIEALKDGKELAALQNAFVVQNGTQCGFCTPGMIMAAVNLLEKNKSPSESEIREAMAGNLCRCTGYVKIVTAIEMAATEIRGGEA